MPKNELSIQVIASLVVVVVVQHCHFFEYIWVSAIHTKTYSLRALLQGEMQCSFSSHSIISSNIVVLTSWLVRILLHHFFFILGAFDRRLLSSVQKRSSYESLLHTYIRYTMLQK